MKNMNKEKKHTKNESIKQTHNKPKMANFSKIFFSTPTYVGKILYVHYAVNEPSTKNKMKCMGQGIRPRAVPMLPYCKNVLKLPHISKKKTN